MDYTERVLRIGEMKLASILCDLERYLALRIGNKKAEEFVNEVEAKILAL